MQDSLVMLDHLVFDCKRSHEKLAWMSIHDQIKAAREKKGWSMERLATEVSKAEKTKKILAWQTVQQWERGKSAPKRTRLSTVARLLGVDLGAANENDGWPFPDIARRRFTVLTDMQKGAIQWKALEMIEKFEAERGSGEFSPSGPPVNPRKAA